MNEVTGFVKENWDTILFLAGAVEVFLGALPNNLFRYKSFILKLCAFLNQFELKGGEL